MLLRRLFDREEAFEPEDDPRSTSDPYCHHDGAYRTSPGSGRSIEDDAEEGWETEEEYGGEIFAENEEEEGEAGRFDEEGPLPLLVKVLLSVVSVAAFVGHSFGIDRRRIFFPLVRDGRRFRFRIRPPAEMPRRTIGIDALSLLGGRFRRPPDRVRRRIPRKDRGSVAHRRSRSEGRIGPVAFLSASVRHPPSRAASVRSSSSLPPPRSGLGSRFSRRRPQRSAEDIPSPSSPPPESPPPPLGR